MKTLRCGRFLVPLGRRTLIMGILNVTPDSFSDGGRFFHPGRAVAQALQMQEEGADLIDIGGESTRPGARPVSAREEMKRILPVIERLSARLRIPISVDTSKALVARRAILAGACLINDVTALRDPKMPEVVAQAGVPVILMHTRGTPRSMRRLARYRRLLPEILAELKQSIQKALNAGIRKDRILIDPGIGFAKGPEDSLQILRHLRAFKRLGFPMVVGPSRKSFIGYILERPFSARGGLAFGGDSVRGSTGSPRTGNPGHPEHVEADRPAQDRLFGTAAAVACAAAQGAEILRVHDVAAMRQVADLAQAIAQAE